MNGPSPAPVAALVPAPETDESTALAVIDNPLADYELRILHSERDPRGRRFVPGGPLKATRLGTTSQKLGAFHVFPHVLFSNGEGEHEYLLETDKNTTVRVAVVRKSDPEDRVSEEELLAVLNADLTKPHVETLGISMRFKFQNAGPDGQRESPRGIGLNKSFDKLFSDGLVPASSQLLVPPESQEHNYHRTLHGGAVSFSFKVRSGVTSVSSLPRGSKFVFEVGFTDPRLAHFPPAVSPPFWIKSKFSTHLTSEIQSRLGRGEMWVESRTEGSPPELVAVRKRPRTE
jgi:hypothetical protein